MTGEELLKQQDEQIERNFCESLRFYGNRWLPIDGAAVLPGENVDQSRFDPSARARESASGLLARIRHIRSEHSVLAVEFASELAAAEQTLQDRLAA